MKPIKIGVLVSGGGTNLQKIIDEKAAGRLNVEIAVVISNKSDAYGLKRASRAGINAVNLNTANYSSRSEYDKALRDTLKSHGVELVVMAGYMILLGKEVLDAFPYAVINLHPALLPAFPGSQAIEDAFNAGVEVTGVTVHFANQVYDEGPIIAQKEVPVMKNDTLESLEKRIHAAEYELLPQVIQMIAAGKVTVEEGEVKVGK